jgi:membrane protein
VVTARTLPLTPGARDRARPCAATARFTPRRRVVMAAALQRESTMPKVVPFHVARQSPWKLGGLSIVELARRVWSEISEDEVFDRAAALSYYFLFALFPALLFMTALFGLLPIPNLIERVVGYLERVLPGDAASLVTKTLGEIVKGAHGGLLSIGVLGALWAGSNGMVSIITALNVAYEATENRPWWRRRLVAVALTVAFSLFTLLAMLILIFGGKIGELVAGWVGLGPVFSIAWGIVQWPLVAMFVLTGIALVYYFAPAVEQPWHWVTPGAVVALVIWIGMSLGLRTYVTYFGNYNATYGSIGGVILLMLWLYLSGVVLLIGAEINSEIERAAARRPVRHPEVGSLAAVAPRVDGALTAAGEAVAVPAGLVARATALVRLRLELTLTEGKRLLKSLGIAAAVGLLSGLFLLAGAILLIAAGFAPLFQARWEPLVVAGGGVALLSAAGVAWTVWRIKHIEWPTNAAAALREDWQWLETQLRSRRT